MADLGGIEQADNWEEWLRWDPTAEATSPDDGTFHSGSSTSKNDSPIQDPALAVHGGMFSKDDTLAPPLVVGEDVLNFSQDTFAAPGDTFMFGAPEDAAYGFDFDAALAFQPVQQIASPSTAQNPAWMLPSNVLPQEMTLSAMSNLQIPVPIPVSTAPPSQISQLLSQHPISGNQTSVSTPSPPGTKPAKKRVGRKRKAETEPEPQPPSLQQQSNEENENSQDGSDGPPVKKTSHHVIEKRYRNNLADKIVELRNSVPSLRVIERTGGGDVGLDDEDLGGLTPAHKLNKATIMAKATEYIRHLEKRNATMAEEMAQLKAQIAAVEQAFGKSIERQASISGSPPTNNVIRPRQTSSSSQQAPSQTYASAHAPQDVIQGLYDIPQQQQYMQHQTQPTYTRPPAPPVEAMNQSQQRIYGRGGGRMNKLVMGAMAGVMVMEGYNGQQQQDGSGPDGLFAVPTSLFKRGMDFPIPTSPTAFARHATLPLIKLVCAIGALIYLLAPLFSYTTRRKKQQPRLRLRLPQAPSLASPVEVRRAAWQTAMQTVYVPRHFLLHVFAVTTKMAALSLRRLIGTESFNALTSTNKDEEAARVKAWCIAIDAQLAGGDADVSYYRLLLTLMESGTLPDGPVRLMQKAVHFRVFFWEVANAGYGNMSGFKLLTERVAKVYWDSARKLQKDLVHARSQGRPMSDGEDEAELLPAYLERLVELECEDVLSDEMIQRAWNLAWNKPSAYKTGTRNAARDNVVEDHAIRSPMDAVAAWHANTIIDEALIATISGPTTSEAQRTVDLAIAVAPTASATHLRALVARAVLSDSASAGAHILAALDEMPAVSSPTTTAMNLVAYAPASPDLKTALTLAKVLSLQQSGTAQSGFSILTRLRLAPADLTLVTAVAVSRLLMSASVTDGLDSSHRSLEQLAGNLRVWAGTSKSSRAGLGEEERGILVECCLGFSKKAGGWGAGERDSGYGSGSVSSLSGSPILQ